MLNGIQAPPGTAFPLRLAKGEASPLPFDPSPAAIGPNENQVKEGLSRGRQGIEHFIVG